MRLNAPKKATFVVALMLVLVAVIGKIVGMAAPVEFLRVHSLWLAAVGYVILMLGTSAKGA